MERRLSAQTCARKIFPLHPELFLWPFIFEMMISGNQLKTATTEDTQYDYPMGYVLKSRRTSLFAYRDSIAQLAQSNFIYVYFYLLSGIPLLAWRN